MENASKALIIAGAILISILLIGVGVMVMNGAQGGIDEAIASMSSQEKEMFNTKFTQYAGTKVKGTNVRALIQNIISSNSTNQDIVGKFVGLDVTGVTDIRITGEGAVKTVTGETTSPSAAMSKIRTAINTGATYTVEVEYNDDTGLVDNVKILTPSE